MGLFKRLLSIFKSTASDPGSRRDRALTHISLRDDVAGTKVNVDGTITVFVKGPVMESYDDIVRFLRKNAPDLHGDVRRAVDMPIPVVPSHSQQTLN